MAHPADPAPKVPVAFAHARLSPEEADRLASMFRPSWELDDAPFTGAGTLSAGDMQALQAAGSARADLRAAATAPFGSNGASAPAPVPAAPAIELAVPSADVVQQPQAARPAPINTKSTIMGMGGLHIPALEPRAPEPAAPAPAPTLSRPPSRPSQRPAAPNFQIGPPTPRARPVVVAPAADVPSFPKKSQTGLWLGLGAAAVLVLGIGVWAVTGTSEKPAPPAAAATEKPTEDKLSSVPPPPPATATVTAAPVRPPTAAAPPPVPVPTTPVTALPVAPPPPPTHVAVGASPPHPASYGAPAAPPHAAPRKGGPTIVRDVPF